jgi:Acetyltransferases
MENSLSNQLNYKVVKASTEQTESIIDTVWNNPEIKQRIKDKCKIIFIAVDENENILGRLIIEEKQIPPPLSGTDWWLYNLYVHRDFRRMGIASALIKEVIKYAKQANIIHLQGVANPTLQAHMFYNKHNFSFLRYSKKNEDVNSPLEYGNYGHVFFYRIEKYKISKTYKHKQYRILKLNKNQLNKIINDNILNINPEFPKDKINGLFGYTAVDAEGNTVGIIIGYADEMYAPLDGMCWWIPYILVHAELRRDGIGSVLIRKMARAAKAANIKQLNCTFPDDESEFWHSINFDILFWKYLGSTNKIATASLRLL